ncbi:MAG: GntR family transcriptional regulator [Gemmatimonadota bacterium]
MPVDLHDLMAEAVHRSQRTPEMAAIVLREAILSGRFSDLQPLRQEDLATQLGVSKIPVREALRQLEAEGLVTFYPNRGVVVTTLSAAESDAIAEMRVALETLAIRHAIDGLSPRDLRVAASALDDLDHETDVARWSRHNWDFHARLYAPCGRPLLLSTIQGLHTRVDRYIRLVLSTLGHQAQSQREHRGLLDACSRRDIAGAVQVLTEHIEGAGSRLAAFLSLASKARRDALAAVNASA